MAISEFSKICMICIVTLLSVAMASQQSPQPSLTNDTIPADDELISLAAASSPSQSPYAENLDPETGAQELLSPDYSPFPAPTYFQDYPSPPPYIEAQAPESYYAFYSPIQGPSLAPSSERAQFSDTNDFTSPPNLAPQPNVLPSNYRADDEIGELGELESDEAYNSEQNKNRATMAGFALGSVCLVGLAGFVYKKKKYSKSKADYEYELAKREDL
ncbi:hypothetical protein ACFX12_032452 [Malus domestica]